MFCTTLKPWTGREPEGIAQDAQLRAFAHALARATGTEGDG